MKFNPLFNLVLIKPEQRKEKSAGGIIIPETAQIEPLYFGEVIAAGDKCEYVKPGDKVLYQVSAFDNNMEQDVLGSEINILAIKVDDKLQMIHNYVLVNPKEISDKTSGGIIINTNYINLIEGEIISCGSKCEYMSEGLTAFFDRTLFGDLEIEGEKFKIGIEANVLALV